MKSLMTRKRSKTRMSSMMRMRSNHGGNSCTD
jgi:hypothetical protein